MTSIDNNRHCSTCAENTTSNPAGTGASASCSAQYSGANEVTRVWFDMRLEAGGGEEEQPARVVRRPSSVHACVVRARGRDERWFGGSVQARAAAQLGESVCAAFVCVSNSAELASLSLTGAERAGTSPL